MEISFIDLSLLNVIFLFLVGFVGGLVSGFIGSGGAFVLTPAMMNMGVSAIMAVASNICHKFPKALVGAMKRHKYGQVDVKLGIVLGISAEAGVLYGAHLQEAIVQAFGKAGSNLYVSVVFVVVLAVVGGYVLRDAWKMYHSENPDEEKVGKLAQWVMSVNIPGTMVYFKGINGGKGGTVSVLFTIPMGFATGMLAATIAVGGFIGVPAMMYLLGVPGLMASATELVIAFVMGLGGTVKYAWSGFVDIRLAMIILAGSLFGIQLGAIGTTYVKPYMVKIVMGVIMILVLFSRGVAIPVYLSDLDLISRMTPETASLLKNTSFGMMIFALMVGAFIVLKALIKGMREHRAESATAGHFSAAITATPRTAMKRMLLVLDGSEYSDGAAREAIRMAKKCGSKLHIMTVVPDKLLHDGLGTKLQDEERRKAMANLTSVQERAQAAGVDSEILVSQGPDAFQVIVNEAERGLMDLIVMGRRDRSDLSRALLGSTAAKVIGHTSCNVLVVPRGASFEGKGILVAVDGSRHAEAAASVVAGMMQLCKAPVTAISAAIDARLKDDAKNTLKRAQQWLDGVGVKAAAEVLVGAPDEVIAAKAKESKADLIVMGSRGLNGLDRLLLGSVSERVIGRAECPVMVVRG